MSKELVERLRKYNPTSGYTKVMREAADTIETLLAAINECYQMLLTEPSSKVAADRAEAMLREVIAKEK